MYQRARFLMAESFGLLIWSPNGSEKAIGYKIVRTENKILK